MLIDTALRLALTAHVGQVDKAGQPYILHPLRLMHRFTDPVAQAVALLHDVIEDTDVTAEHLLQEGIPNEVVSAVLALTRHESESYSQFITRAGRNPLARRVKMADIEDNIQVLRLTRLTDQDLKRIAKYHKAWYQLGSMGEGEI